MGWKIALFLLYIFEVMGSNKMDNFHHRLPSYFPQCHRNDPEINKCMLEATEKVRPYLKIGVAELNIPPLDPLLIPQIILQQGSKSVNFKAVLTNTSVYGLTSYKFKKFEVDIPNLRFNFNFQLDNLELRGNYNVTGTLLIAKLEGKGNFQAKIDNGEITVSQQYQTKIVKGHEYIVPTYTNSTISVSGPKATLEGLFEDNPQLRDATQQIINDNVDELFQEIKPVVEETLARIMENIILKSVVSHIPYDRLYPINQLN